MTGDDSPVRLVYIFSLCLALGVILSQIFDLSSQRENLIFLTRLFLSYILMEVGLEFVLNKRKWASYLFDFFVAATAAIFPWIFCFLYFLHSGNDPWRETLLISLFAAPTSSGILFTMLAAAGLASTWVFRKVQILAILDDVVTILLMVPIQLLLVGPRWELFVVILITFALLGLGYRFLHQIKLPVKRTWILFYSFFLVAFLEWIYQTVQLEIAPLLPAFIFGSLLYNPHNNSGKYLHEHSYIEPQSTAWMIFDRTIKIFFMLLVGLVLPRVHFSELILSDVVRDVLLVAILSNIGKCVLIFFYKKESHLRERIAVCLGMFIRGEMAAGVFALSVQHGISEYTTTVVVVSLILNLLLTSLLITGAAKLIKPLRT